MSKRLAGRSLALCALVVSVGCAGSPNGPSEVATHPTGTLTLSPGGGASTSSGSGVSAQTEGSFRVKPAPDANGIIVVDVGQKLIVNANDDRAANPSDTLHLVVNWGDGPNERVPCGPCRLEHAYTKGGRYEMEATIDDGKGTTASHRYRVEARGSGLAFDATPARIPPGGSTILAWDTLDATSVTIDNGIGSVDAQGQVSVSPAATTTYTLTATGPSGTTRARVTVVVSWIKVQTVDPSTIGVGGTALYTIEGFPGFPGGLITPCNPAVATLSNVVGIPNGLTFDYTGVGPGQCDTTANLGGFVETVTLVVQ